MIKITDSDTFQDVPSSLQEICPFHTVASKTEAQFLRTWHCLLLLQERIIACANYFHSEKHVQIPIKNEQVRSKECVCLVNRLPYTFLYGRARDGAREIERGTDLCKEIYSTHRDAGESAAQVSANAHAREDSVNRPQFHQRVAVY